MKVLHLLPATMVLRLCASFTPRLGARWTSSSTPSRLSVSRKAAESGTVVDYGGIPHVSVIVESAADAGAGASAVMVRAAAVGEVFALASRWLPESCALRRFFSAAASTEKSQQSSRRELAASSRCGWR